MKKLTLSSMIAVASLAAAASAFAQSGFQVKPGTYDPDKGGNVAAAWVAGIGLSDGGTSNHGLLLQKNGLTSENSASGASVSGVSGIILTEAGFDYKNGGHCGAGAPRFNVVATDGFHFLGGCSNGTPSAGPAVGWTRVRIDPQNPAQAFPIITPGATVLAMSITFDEGTDQGTGSVILDNIDINGTLIGKPGNTK